MLVTPTIVPRANLITDVPGLSVGHAEDRHIGSGTSVVLFDQPAVAAVAIHGGAPGLRDSALLEPEMTIEKVDALVLSGGSAFGLDSMGGVAAYLREIGRGFAIRDLRVPIVPGAILFDLLNGGDKAWGSEPVYWHLGYRAAAATSRAFSLGSVGAGLGATTANLKGGIGSASALSSSSFWVGALVAVNALGQATIGERSRFWASPYERDSDVRGLGWPQIKPHEACVFHIKGDAPENTTIGIVAMRVDARTRSAAELDEFLKQFEFPLVAHLRDTQVYVHCARDGATVFDLPRSRAEQDWEQWRPLTRWIARHAAPTSG